MPESPALKRYLQALGRVQHHLHTVVVGLSAVENGTATKAVDLDISWDPKDIRGSAREARSWVLRACLVFAAEGIAEFVARQLRLRATLEGNPATLSDKQTQRIRDLEHLVHSTPDYLWIAPVIIRHWRNRIIHRTSQARLTSTELARFTSNAADIAANFKGVAVDRLLADWDQDRPSLKDVTVLIAMSTRWARLVDGTLPPISTARDVHAWLTAEELLDDVLTLERQSRGVPNADVRARGRQLLITRAALLADPYYRLGTT